MGCRLFGVKLLSEPMLGYCQLDHWEQTPVRLYSECKTFHLKKIHLKMLSGKYRPFCLGLSVLTPNHHLHHCWLFVNRIFGKPNFKMKSDFFSYQKPFKGGYTTILISYTIIRLDNIKQNKLLGIIFTWDIYIYVYIAVNTYTTHEFTTESGYTITDDLVCPSRIFYSSPVSHCKSPLKIPRICCVPSLGIIVSFISHKAMRACINGLG